MQLNKKKGKKERRKEKKEGKRKEGEMKHKVQKRERFGKIKKRTPYLLVLFFVHSNYLQLLPRLYHSLLETELAISVSLKKEGNPDT